jgi:restriction system protein
MNREFAALLFLLGICYSLTGYANNITDYVVAPASSVHHAPIYELSRTPASGEEKTAVHHAPIYELLRTPVSELEETASTVIAVTAEEAVAAYEKGKYAEALQEATPLAQQGDAIAQNLLGVIYYYGQGVAIDSAMAANWFRKAAAQGNADALIYLPKVEEVLKIEEALKNAPSKPIEQPKASYSPPDTTQRNGGLGGAMAIGVVILLVLAIVIWFPLWLWDVKRKKEQAEQAQLEEEQKNAQAQLDEQAKQVRRIMADIIKKHVQELSTRQQQLVIVEAYGLKNTKKWEEEKQHFIDQVMKPALAGVYNLSGETQISVSLVIDAAIKNFQEEHPTLAGSDYSEECSGVEYEQYCARLLTEAGWEARTTKTTGDQGGDIIATKDGTTIIIQCKKYSVPVGNAAVQQVHAALSFYKANKAAVVSNAIYTPSAKQLAGTTGVLLLHHNDLPSLTERCCLI